MSGSKLKIQTTLPSFKYFFREVSPCKFLGCLFQMEIWSRYSFFIENFRKAFITNAFNPIVVLSPLFKDFQKPVLYYPVKFNALWPTYSRID